MACRDCGDQIWYQPGYGWTHDDEDGVGLDEDHLVEPDDEDEAELSGDRVQDTMDAHRKGEGPGPVTLIDHRKATTMTRRTADNESMYDAPAKPSGGGTLNPLLNLPGAGAMTGQEQTPAFNPGPQAPSLFGPAGQGINTTGGDPSLFGPNGGTEYPVGAPGPQGGTDGAATGGMMPLDWGSPVSGGTGKPSGQNVGLPPQTAPMPTSSGPMSAEARPSAPLPSGGGKTGALRVAAIDFLAGENVTDREELLFRAHRHASNLTCQLPVPVAQRVVQAFVAAVDREIAAAPAPRRKAARTAAVVVTDFPDELMF